jgi:hypothetical protein
MTPNAQVTRHTTECSALQRWRDFDSSDTHKGRTTDSQQSTTEGILGWERPRQVVVVENHSPDKRTSTPTNAALKQ